MYNNYIEVVKWFVHALVNNNNEIMKWFEHNVYSL